MADLLNTLHDEIDQLEDFRNRARAIVVDVIKNELAGALDAVAAAGAPDIPAAMMLLAARVEEELAPLTTEAFKAGVGFARKRRGAG